MKSFSHLFFAILILSASFKAKGQTFEEAEKLFFSYHEDLTRIEKSIEILEDFINSHPNHITAMVLLSRAYLTYGDCAAKNDKDKLRAYEKGSEWGKKAVEIDEKNALAHFWYFANLGRIQQMKGIFYGLKVLSTLKHHIQRAYELAPVNAEIVSALGSFYRELPGFAGGDEKKAEEFFKKALSLDPNYSLNYYEYALLLFKQKRYRDAEEILLKVLELKNPTYIADYIAWDEPLSRELLKKVREKIKK